MPTLTIKNKKINYQDTGQGSPILFGHSYLWDAEMWEPQIQELSKTHRCIIPELWGHGNSNTAPKTSYDLQTLANEHKEFLDQLNIKKTHLIGLSIGGMWGTYLTLSNPQYIKSLTLIATDLGEEPAEKKQKYLAMIAAIEQLQTIPEQLIKELTPIFFSPNTIKNKPDLVNIFKEKLQNIKKEQIPTIAIIGKSFINRKSIIEKLKDIQVPTQIIVGEQDAARPPHEAQRLQKNIPNSTLKTIKNAGHITNLEQPKEITQLIKTFIK
jgi:pimeloyl-ACP methyl ester carboxylesterase